MGNTNNSIQNKKRASVLGFPVDIATKEEAMCFAESCIKEKRNLHVVTINPEIILSAEKNPELESIINNAGLIIPDSTGMELALKSVGIMAKKVAGIEFSELLIQRCAEKQYKVAFLGATEEVIRRLEKEFISKYPALNIVFIRNGYFSDEDIPQISENIRQANPDLLLVAMGAPRQEYFIKNCMEILSGTVMIGIGGSFDVWAKKVKRAPVIFRMFGLEWLYRLIKQPSRFRRMFPSLPLFLIRTVFFKEKMRKEY